MSASVAPRFDPARRRAVTIALLLVTALASFESTIVSTAMPTIIGELHGLPLYSWVFSIYLLASTVTMPIYGRLADVYGRRRILMTATAVFLAGAVTCALARSMPQLIVARGLQGLGAGGLIPIALTVSGDLYSLEERARVQAFFSGVWGFASLVGPLLGAFLTVTFGWRSIFTINVPLGIIAFVLVATKMIESRKPGSDPVDVAGAELLRRTHSSSRGDFRARTPTASRAWISGSARQARRSFPAASRGSSAATTPGIAWGITRCPSAR